jgi:8-oxo-dGTP diphosphatase
MAVPTFGSKLDDGTYNVRKGAYAVVFEDGTRARTGLIRVKHHYFLPGGGIKNDETAEQCLQRKILEETGFSIKNVSYIGHAQQYLITRKGQPLINNGYFYTADLVKQVQQPTGTDHFFEWVDRRSRFESLMLREQQIWVIRQAIKNNLS